MRIFEKREVAFGDKLRELLRIAVIRRGAEHERRGRVFERGCRQLLFSGD